MDITKSVRQSPADWVAETARTVQLKCHPDTRNEAVHAVSATVRVSRGGAIALNYLLEAKLSRLSLPAHGAGRRTDGLWRHTCFEAFFATQDAPGYCEFNFAPSLDWAVYAFSRYRERALPPKVHGPEIAVRRDGDRLAVDAVLRAEHLPRLHPGAGWRIGLSAVIENAVGVLTYWAIEHAPGKPDFHHPDGFALELTPPLPSGAFAAADGEEA